MIENKFRKGLNQFEYHFPNIEVRIYDLVEPRPLRSVPTWMESMSSRLEASSKLSRHLAHQMSNNTTINRQELKTSRPLSSYFSIGQFDSESVQPLLLIEMGLITEDGSAKLHDYLNSCINYYERCKKGYHLFSGHYAEFELGGLALIDQISYDLLSKLNHGQINLASSLVGNNILPITADGFSMLSAVTT